MNRESKYFPLTLDQLRAIGGWAADCAERALPIYEALVDSDPRPRAAIEGIRAFAGGGKRTAQLRRLALDALAAAREVDAPAGTAAASAATAAASAATAAASAATAAASAATAAALAASSAYTHPLADVHQTKHIVGPAAHAALALELNCAGDPAIGDGEVRWAIEHASAEVREVLQQMPARQPGKSRLDMLLYQLDAGIRGRTLP